MDAVNSQIELTNAERLDRLRLIRSERYDCIRRKGRRYGGIPMTWLFHRFGLKRLHALAICSVVLMVPSKSGAEFAGIYKVATHPPFLAELGSVPFGVGENIVIFGPSPNIQMSLAFANGPHFLN